MEAPRHPPSLLIPEPKGASYTEELSTLSPLSSLNNQSEAVGSAAGRTSGNDECDEQSYPRRRAVPRIMNGWEGEEEEERKQRGGR